MIFFFLCPDTPPLPFGKGHQEPWVFMGRSLSSSGLPCGSILSPSVPSVPGSDRGAVCGRSVSQAPRPAPRVQNCPGAGWVWRGTQDSDPAGLEKGAGPRGD